MVIFPDKMIGIQIKFNNIAEKGSGDIFLWNWIFSSNICMIKLRKLRIIYNIEVFLQKILRYNDKLANTIRIQLKKEDKTFSDKTEDFYVTYVW